MFEEIEKCEGFPVVALAMNKNGNTIAIKSNQKGHGESTDSKTHAEFVITENDNVNFDEVVTLLITLPACSECLTEIKSKFKNLKEIKYLFDPWGKIHKKYVRESQIKFTSINGIENEYVIKMWKTLLERYNVSSHHRAFKRLKKIHRSSSIEMHLSEEKYLKAKKSLG